MNYPDWVDLSGLPPKVDGYYGFVYEITMSNGRKYIGKKKLTSERKVKLGKKELASLTDRRKSKFKIVIKESDWKTYIGSNHQLKEDITNGAIILERKILKLCKTSKELTYMEAKYMFEKDVLIKDEYYNDNILGKFFRKDVI